MLKIVIIDDSRIIRERLSAMLTEPGVIEVVGEAASAAGGIEMVRSLDPGFVILDIRMPGESGIEALAQIKRLRPGARVVVLTNYTYPAYSKRCYELGADYFFDKSSEFEMVKSILGLYSGGAVGKERSATPGSNNPQRVTETAPAYAAAGPVKDLNL